MPLKDHLNTNSSIEFNGEIFRQNNFQDKNDFEDAYIELRLKEGRVYSDADLKNLPAYSSNTLLRNEWLLRSHSLDSFRKYLQEFRTPMTILELGCGNGWFSNAIANERYSVCGVDVNSIELHQGARVFRSNENLSFLLADIFTLDLRALRFDIIVMAGSIQYFSDLPHLLDKLSKLLTENGEIHIIDSPLYESEKQAIAAKMRSADYYKSMGATEMIGKYYHHKRAALEGRKFKLKYDPTTFLSKLNRKIFGRMTPNFPWIVIAK